MKPSLPRRLGLLGLGLAIACTGCAGRGWDRSPVSLIVTDTGESHPRMQAMLAHECLAAGGGQSLTVRAERGVGVVYESTYADGESGREPPQGKGYGGNGLGVITDQALEASWTVSEEAPPGIVVVYASAFLGDSESLDPERAITRLRLSFLLDGPDQDCPEGAPEIPTPDVLTDTGDSHPDLRATLAHGCVEAGDRQTLKLRGARSGGSLTYNTIYANGESGRPMPVGGGYGGSGFGVLGPGAETELVWDIEDDAPPGVARVVVAVSLRNQTARVELAFRVASPGEECR